MWMKLGSVALCGSAFAAAAFAPAANAACTYKMVALLAGEQVVPVSASTAIGAAEIIVDTDANTLSYRMVFSGLAGAETDAHIQGPADPGVNGPVLVHLPVGSPKVGVWTYPETLEDAILDGRTYINIHSVGFPGGELRGQIVTHVAKIDSMQEVPPVTASFGSGWGVFVVNPKLNTMKYHIVFGGLTGVETVQHIHGNSNYGVSSGVKHPLPVGSPKIGVWNYAEADEVAILRGLTYVNIHSTIAPGGEIRGQIVPTVVTIAGDEEVPANPSTAAGYGLIALNVGADTLGYDIRHNVANETVAHFHGFSPPGVNSGVVHGLTAPANRKLGVWAYPAASEAAILDGRTYINIHSVAFPGGEIRGQVEFNDLPCAGNVDGDGDIDDADLGVLLAGFGTSTGSSGFSRCADLDGDGDIDDSDLGILLANFGLACP